MILTRFIGSKQLGPQILTSAILRRFAVTLSVGDKSKFVRSLIFKAAELSSQQKRPLYFDNQATTPTDPRYIR